MSDQVFHISMAMIVILILIAVFTEGWRRGVAYGFKYAVKNCKYESAAVSEALLPRGGDKGMRIVTQGNVDRNNPPGAAIPPKEV
jgi:hypothetical protein